jgi:propanol-preferring alcohol dehydrogenase
MKALKVVDRRKVAVEDVPDPRPQGNEVVVRVEAAPICGSDLHGLYQSPGAKPFVIGHEGAGVVVAVDQPAHVKVGDRVMFLPFITCGRCEWCRAGHVSYCSAKRGVYGFGLDGFQAEMVRITESCLLPLPESVSLEVGALILDPIGTPFHACRRIGANASQTVGVFGLGPMGLGAVANLAHLGARVIGVDPVAYRRELAIRLGAAQGVDPGAGNAVEQIRALTQGHGLDAAMECSGHPDALTAALDSVRPFGHVALIGESRSATISPSKHIIHKEVCLSGSCCFPLGDYAAILRALDGGLGARAGGIITHRFPLEKGPEAYGLFEGGQTGKVVFTRS